jgi:hypothetical protein
VGRSERNGRRAIAGLLCGLAGLAALSGLTGCGGGKAQAEKGGRIEEQVGLDEDGIKVRQGQAENLIRDCMKAQGFDYVPVDPAAQQAALTGVAGMSKDDFEKQFGYGISTLYEQRRKQAVAGPNKAIRDSLSEADRKAYDHALYGDDPTATFAEAVDSGDYSRLGGCVKSATDTVFGGADTLQSLSTKLDELDQKIRADARMVKAVKAWSDCMRDAGYPGLTEQEQVDTVLKKKLEAIVGSAADNASVVGASTVGAASEPDYDHAALAALQREEVAMAAADKKCEDADVAPVEDKVTGEYENAFRQENAALLAKVPKK